MPDLYQVVFTGALASTVAQEQVVRDFAAVFKVPEEKAWRLVLSNSEHVLKKDIDRANAERYRQLLEEIGLVVRVEPMDAVPAAAPAMEPLPEPAAAPARQWTPPPAPAAAAAAERNPYAPPAADLTIPAARGGQQGFTGPHGLPAGRGWGWVGQGWGLFKQAPFAWIGAFLVYLLITLVAGLIPFLGAILTYLFGPVLVAGFYHAADRQHAGEGFAVGNIFHGFSNRLGPLVGLGAIFLGFIVAIGILFGLVFVAFVGVSGGFDPTAMEQNPELLMAAMGPVGVILILAFMLVVIPASMAYWFAPPLVLLNGQAPIAALELSFTGCWRNILPFLLFGLALFLWSLLIMVVMALAMAAAEWLGFVVILLAMLAFGPVAFAASYMAYREIFYSSRVVGRHASTF